MAVKSTLHRQAGRRSPQKLAATATTGLTRSCAATAGAEQLIRSEAVWTFDTVSEHNAAARLERGMCLHLIFLVAIPTRVPKSLVYSGDVLY